MRTTCPSSTLQTPLSGNLTLNRRSRTKVRPPFTSPCSLRGVFADLCSTCGVAIVAARVYKRRPPRRCGGLLFVHGVLLSVQVGELLLLDDLGDRASGASVLASATGDAGVLVSDGSDVLELQNASGAGVDANATSDALVGINYGMSHGSFLSVDRRYRRCASV